MTPLLWLVFACSSPDTTDDPKGGITDDGIYCDNDAGTADVSSTPALDLLIDAYEAASGVTWGVTLDCDDGIDRTITLAYTAVPRSEIAVSEVITDGYNGPAAEACDYGHAETPVEISGDFGSYVGTLDARFQPGGETRIAMGWDEASVNPRVDVSFYQDPPEGPVFSGGAQVGHDEQGYFYCPATPAVALDR
ncbi:MAG: hypothetical protein ABMB14_22070 [Myxococcota bacterium]